MENDTEKKHISQTVDFNHMLLEIDRHRKGTLKQLQSDLGIDSCYRGVKDILK